jgi:uncharacterized membrane protein (DUF106 family)
MPAAPGPTTPPPAPKGGGSTFTMLFVMMFVMIIVMDPNVRAFLGGGVSGLFTPVFGFGGAFPLWTIFAASVVLVIFTTVVRHFFTDWVAQGRQKHVSNWVQKEYKNIRERGNLTKMKELNEYQAEMMKQSGDSMAGQMKTTVVTIVVAMAIFLWLGVFLYEGTVSRMISVPWSMNFDYTTPGPFLHIMPSWILLYSLLSLPLGQAIGAALKIWSFKRKLHTIEEGTGIVRERRSKE